MMSVKYFNNWIKEAGRGHITAIVSWISFAVYGSLTISRLSLDTEYTYFGIGSMELSRICACLGIVIAFSEFFYLLQQKKQDFYYSLPVKKSTIFWSRYFHGMLHFVISLSIVMIICSIYQSTIDEEFRLHAVGYSIKSILIFTAIFLMFYHIAAVSIVVCGKLYSAVLVTGILIFYFQLFINGICQAFIKSYFATYYKIPVIEKLNIVLVPLSLSGKFSGTDLFEKEKILTYLPNTFYGAAVFLWLAVPFLIFAWANRTRKTEATGKVFAVPGAERSIEFLISFSAALWAGGFLLEVTHINEKSRLLCGIIVAAVGAITAVGVHCLFEWIVENTKRKIFRRKPQLIAEIVSAVIGGVLFLGYAPVYDNFFPAKETLKTIGVSVNGLDMGHSEFIQNTNEDGKFITDRRLKQYTFSSEGMEAAKDWIQDLKKSEDVGNHIVKTGSQDSYTFATVCYHMEGGKERYRTYSVSRRAFDAFSNVYNTAEYKSRAYPVFAIEDVNDLNNNGFTWSDGISQKALKLSDSEKATLITKYKEDIEDLRMEDLKGQLPSGEIEIESQISGRTPRMIIYPFFGQTCTFLGQHGVKIDTGLSNYAVESIMVHNVLHSTAPGTSGGTIVQIYDEKEDIEKWDNRLVPQKFDVQTLMSPLDYSIDAEAEVNEETTNSIIKIDCYAKLN